MIQLFNSCVYLEDSTDGFKLYQNYSNSLIAETFSARATEERVLIDGMRQVLVNGPLLGLPCKLL